MPSCVSSAALRAAAAPPSSGRRGGGCRRCRTGLRSRPRAFGLGWAQASLRSRWTESCGGGLVSQPRRAKDLSQLKRAPELRCENFPHLHQVPLERVRACSSTPRILSNDTLSAPGLRALGTQTFLPSVNFSTNAAERGDELAVSTARRLKLNVMSLRAASCPVVRDPAPTTALQLMVELSTRSSQHVLTRPRYPE